MASLRHPQPLNESEELPEGIGVGGGGQMSAPPPDPARIPSGPAIDSALIGDAPPQYGEGGTGDEGSIGVGPMPTYTAEPAPTQPPGVPQEAPVAPPTPTPLSGGYQAGQGMPAPQGAAGSLQSALAQPDLFNKDVTQRRVTSAREDLERQRSAEMDTIMAQLAEQGLIGSGAEQKSLEQLAERMYGKQSQTISDIYAQQGNAADDRMIQLLSLTTGLSIEEAKRAVEMAQLGEQGQEFNANYGLNAQRLAGDLSNAPIDQLIELFKALSTGAGRTQLG